MLEPILIVDMGNTLTKFALVNEKGIVNRLSYAIKSKPVLIEIDLLTLNNEFLNKIKFKKIIISSVVPKNNKQLADFLFETTKIKPVFISDKLNLIVKVSAKEVGVDILCKSTYLASKELEGLIIDSGSATVINYVNKKGFLTKAAITIGFNAMYEALHSTSDQLPIYTPEKAKVVLNNNTRDAIHGGCYFGYLGMLNALAEKVVLETACNNIYFTGGYSFLFKNDVNFKHVYDKELLFKGAYLIYANNRHLFT